MTNATWTGANSSIYKDSENWNPKSVPDISDTATFDDTASTLTVALVGDQFFAVGGWTINSGDYEFDAIIPFGRTLSFHGSGIAVNGGSLTLNVTYLVFNNSSSAGNAHINSYGALNIGPDATAGSAQINAYENFLSDGSLGNATINWYGQIDPNPPPIFPHALINSGVESATINNYELAQISVEQTDNGVVNTYASALTYFTGQENAGTSVIITHGSATSIFMDHTSGGDARFVTKAGGIVNFAHSLGEVDGITFATHKLSAGSIEGAGTYLLGQNELTVGSNNLSTTVSGEIAGGGGSLVKVGTGTLTLSGDNSFDGGIILSEGVLDFASLTAAGTGDVTFDAGTETLVIENSALSSNTFANEIHDFGMGDAIKLGMNFVKGSMKVKYDATSGLLKINNGSKIDAFTLVDPETNSFKVQNAGGKVKIVITTAAARHNDNHNAKVADHDDGGVDFGRGFQLDSHHASVGGHDFF